MACNEDLQAEGKPYPRTCADCGLGKCKKHTKAEKRASSEEDLAATILAMNYGTLMGVAGELSGMIEKDVRESPKTAQQFASILFDWAEAR